MASPSAEWLAARHWLSRVVAPVLSGDLPSTEAGAGLVTICSGALLAADAGLLAGRRCTTHHELLEQLAAHAPTAQVALNRVFGPPRPAGTPPK